ncbi:GNAT family N-acetyltransferase [Bacillus sp. FJAT-42376]|uniref:GNAT family N-acetyltransferase n=1 Tax=Bacillus sp. FJAT-42376 TaxID=2014076 RepID=UPI000F5113F9|nr:GNAT family N-acetyltransferase [Bacillus sp. FJAT-42376]AZB41669.1 GNAT family N-acetyltransferase [Bacillus sp. FJAT-42376]
MKVIKASIENIGDIVPLFNEYRLFYKQKEDLDGARQFIAERLEKNESVIFLAEDEHGYAGFVQLYPSFTSVGMSRTWILNDLYVQGRARNRGAGQMLIDRAADWCRETGAIRLNLETGAENTGAQRLYEKNQFVKNEDCFFYSREVGQ